MKNQPKFDIVTLRAPKDDPEVGGDYYGLPWPCWGKPEIRHPGSHVLYNTDLHVKDGGGTFRARFGVERNGQTLLAEDSIPRIGTHGRVPRVHHGGDEEARLGQGSHGRGDGGHHARRRQQHRRGELGHRPLGRHPARLSRSRRHALRKRQGPGECLEPARSGAGPPRADLHAAARSRGEVPDAARRASVPDAQHRLHGAEGGGGPQHRAATSRSS